jgi:hypothetical protein
VLLDLGDIPEEQRLVEELSLAMTEAKVIKVDPGFGELPLNQQLAQARLVAMDIPAVAWLEVSADKLLVQLAFLTADRADLQVIEVPREPGAESRLALALRELLLEAPQLDSAPILPVPPPVSLAPESSPINWCFRAATGVVLPTQSLAGGPLIRGDIRFTRVSTPAEFGLGLSYANSIANDHQRIGIKLVVGKGWLYAGIGTDLTLLGWTSLPDPPESPLTTLVQPRLELWISPPIPHLVGEFVIRTSFIRDEITYDNRMLYNSGWIEFAFQTGFLQQIRKTSEHK